MSAPDWSEEIRAAYAGRWVAHVAGRIVGQGGTAEQALQAARPARFKEEIQVSFMPMANPFVFSDILERVRAALPAGLAVYLVGGAVRDALLRRPTHDLDFVLGGDVLGTSRRVADRLGAAYFPLNEERDTGRVILTKPNGERQILDFAAYRGADLESDLRGRDFTINAMAVSVHEPDKLLDPTGGLADLRAEALRACSASSFLDDPVRILRGVRLAAAFRFRILPETRRLMRQAASGLPRVSRERVRDELFRILEGPQAATSVRALEMLGAWSYVLPELAALKEVTQSPPHIFDVWDHSLEVMQRLDSLLAVLEVEANEDASASLALGMVSILLGRYRDQLRAHMESPLNPDRSMRGLLFLAALYHDIAKPATRREEESGRIRFFEHDLVGAKMIAERARDLRLSNDEVERLSVIVRHHLRPILLAQSGKQPSRRAVYRFFRDTGEAGVDICLLSLADVLGTYAHSLPQEAWKNQVEVVRALLEAWWEHAEERVFPPALVKGKEIMRELGLEPGPLIGEILESILEAQASGDVRNREEALAFAREKLEQRGGS